MTIFINNEPNTFSKGTTLEQLLKTLNLTEQKGFAIAVNEQVVSKRKWSQYVLKENAQILIIQATQGG